MNTTVRNVGVVVIILVIIAAIMVRKAVVVKKTVAHSTKTEVVDPAAAKKNGLTVTEEAKTATVSNSPPSVAIQPVPTESGVSNITIVPSVHETTIVTKGSGVSEVKTSGALPSIPFNVKGDHNTTTISQVSAGIYYAPTTPREIPFGVWPNVPIDETNTIHLPMNAREGVQKRIDIEVEAFHKVLILMPSAADVGQWDFDRHPQFAEHECDMALDGNPMPFGGKYPPGSALLVGSRTPLRKQFTFVCTKLPEIVRSRE